VDSLRNLGGKVANESDSDVIPLSPESNLEGSALEQSSEEVIEPSV
jgi:hypothetical protein